MPDIDAAVATVDSPSPAQANALAQNFASRKFAIAAF